MKTLFILNPHAAGGRAGRIFQSIEPRLPEMFDDFVVTVTTTIEELGKHLEAAATIGIELVIAVGGDGTNHAVLNALCNRPDLQLIFGSLPIGTGRDWARSLGVPTDPAEAVKWLGQARPMTCDLGRLAYTNPAGKQISRVFLNIASAGASGEVGLRVNQAKRRTPFTFLGASIVTLLKHRAQHVTLTCDDNVFYDDHSHLVVVANGQYFGRGMWPAPNARFDDGLFDVLVLTGVSQLRLMRLLQLVYTGRHIHEPDIRVTRAARVHIHSHDDFLGLECDGEPDEGQDLTFTIWPAALRVLLHPANAAASMSRPPTSN